MRPMIEAFLAQGQRELIPWAKSQEDLLKLAQVAAATNPLPANNAQVARAA
jgi:hypothetical protein